jgi:type IV pilus assembly protein PilP
MERQPVITRFLFCTICVALLLWGCDRTNDVSVKPKVVRKKINFQEQKIAKVSKTRKDRIAKTAQTDKAKKESSTIQKAQKVVKEKPAPKPEVDKRTLVAKKLDIGATQKVEPRIKKPAARPKSEISQIKQPVKIVEPPADSNILPTGKADANKMLIASTPETQKVTHRRGLPSAYDPTGKIDPFEPLLRDKPVPVKKQERKKRIPQTPLERIELSQLKLVAIIVASSGNRALVEETTGKGYVIKTGTYIGKNAGKVVKIKKNKVIVEEEFEDVFGKIKTRQRELKLPKPVGVF